LIGIANCKYSLVHFFEIIRSMEQAHCVKACLARKVTSSRHKAYWYVLVMTSKFFGGMWVFNIASVIALRPRTSTRRAS
jgi:hypothetical protein